MGIELSPEQSVVVDSIRDWYHGARESQRLRAIPRGVTVGGLAGTGKTVLANHIPAMLGIPRETVAYCAYTGKAASRLDGGQTIHSLIYRASETHCFDCPARTDAHEHCHGHGVCCYTSYKLKNRLDDYRLIVVDEASMVPLHVFRQLSAFGVPVLWIGDHGQLPPVRAEGGFNLMADPDLRLETIHRQAADSAILKLAMQAREGLALHPGTYSDTVRVVTSEDAPGFDPERTDLVLVPTNEMRAAINGAARSGRPCVPEPDEPVICLRNNAEAGVYNGTTARVLDCRPLDSSSYRLETDTPYEGTAYAPQFGAPRTLMEVPRSVFDLWDYAYALTVHKAQGSEADSVVLLTRRSIPDKPRWLYTAITRAKESLLVVLP